VELIPGSVRLPKALDGQSVRGLACRIASAIDGGAPIVRLIAHDQSTFCAGMQIDGVLEDRAAMAVFAHLFATLQASPKPLLAVVDGAAIGGGLGLACACDWVIATSRATFGLPELLWGLAPATIWPVVSNRMTPHEAWRWTISAHTRTAAEAVAAGIVDDVVAPDVVARHADRVAARLTRLDSQALVRMRAWARECRQQPLADAVSKGAAITADLATRPEVRRRWQAYVTGGAPWSA
jgi:enoyl-CoA hydratase/carnithine racemase